MPSQKDAAGLQGGTGKLDNRIEFLEEDQFVSVVDEICRASGLDPKRHRNRVARDVFRNGCRVYVQVQASYERLFQGKEVL